MRYLLDTNIVSNLVRNPQGEDLIFISPTLLPSSSCQRVWPD